MALVVQVRFGDLHKMRKRRRLVAGLGRENRRRRLRKNEATFAERRERFATINVKNRSSLRVRTIFFLERRSERGNIGEKSVALANERRR
jgi:hypothetical protein